MASTYSPALRIELIGTGDQSGIWGDTTNTNLGGVIEQAIAGYQSIPMVDANYTLTVLNGTVDQSRNAVIEMTSVGSLTATRDVIVPSSEKLYVFKNSTTGSQNLVLKTLSGTGVTVHPGDSMFLYCDGTNVYECITSVNNGTVYGDLTIEGDATVEGSASLAAVELPNGTANQVQYLNGSKVLSGSVNLTFDGTYLIANSIKDTALTSGRVTYAGASGLLQDSSNLTFNGTTLTVNSLVATSGISSTAVTQRVVSIADGTTVTMNADTTDMATQANTQAAGTLSIAAPTGTPVNGQKIIFRLTSSSVQTFAWNSVFAGSSDLVLPVSSSGSGKTDYMGFMYNSTAAKWQMLSKVFGF